MSTFRPCPHCGNRRPDDWHLRDAGDLPAELAANAGYCPVLTARRNRQPVPA